MRRVAPYAFLSVHIGKALPDIFIYNGITTPRHTFLSQFTNSGNSFARAKMVLGSRSLETTTTSRSSSQFNLRNELQDYTMRFTYL